MNLEVYTYYLLTVVIILSIPGPVVLMVISQSITHGKKVIKPLMLGVALGDLLVMILSLLGIGALLATSQKAYEIVKWLGVCYLIYLGVRTLLSEKNLKLNMAGRLKFSNRNVFVQAFLVSALNPKGIMFFVAFFPQFIDQRADTGLQLVVLGSTFIGLTLVSVFLYGSFASRLRGFLNKPRANRYFNWISGGVLISAGVVAAASEKNG
ncbi:LysE family translocator [Aliikangiella coralliicola]|uniref:LysE family translocator n=1 Tax=Aliikangiella coralliicola TaxID=2592383 RepID=A0A545UHB2_9GAMM|nr:LysE family translocator [Aliikangiella coralliicola]TQV88852.1 LysE family translocator [Aliikangiella coralliicola]